MEMSLDERRFTAIARVRNEAHAKIQSIIPLDEQLSAGARQMELQRKEKLTKKEKTELATIVDRFEQMFEVQRFLLSAVAEIQVSEEPENVVVF